MSNLNLNFLQAYQIPFPKTNLVLKSNNVKPDCTGLRIFGYHVLKTVLFLSYCRWHINGGKSVAINLKRSSKIYKAVVSFSLVKRENALNDHDVSVGVRWGVPALETCWNSIATVRNANLRT